MQSKAVKTHQQQALSWCAATHVYYDNDSAKLINDVAITCFTSIMKVNMRYIQNKVNHPNDYYLLLRS